MADYLNLAIDIVAGVSVVYFMEKIVKDFSDRHERGFRQEGDLRYNLKTGEIYNIRNIE